MHRWSETEAEKHTETVRDKQRHRQTETLFLNALFITCLTRTGLPVCISYSSQERAWGVGDLQVD